MEIESKRIVGGSRSGSDFRILFAFSSGLNSKVVSSIDG